MGWLVFDGHPDGDRHEGFVELVVQVDEDGHWLPVSSLEVLNYGRTDITSDELVSGLWHLDGRRRALVYRVQVACDCGWRSPLLPVPLGAAWAPVSLILDERDANAAADLWERLHRSRLDEWPRSLAAAPVAAMTPNQGTDVEAVHTEGDAPCDPWLAPAETGNADRCDGADSHDVGGVPVEAVPVLRGDGPGAGPVTAPTGRAALSNLTGEAPGRRSAGTEAVA